MAVVENFKEALKQRVGAERYQMWFTHGIEFEIDSAGTATESMVVSDAVMIVRVRGQFALDRLKKNFLRELRGAAMQVCGASTNVELCLDAPPAAQAELPLTSGPESKSSHSNEKSHPESSSLAKAKHPPKVARKRGRGREKAKSVSSLIADGAAVGNGLSTVSKLANSGNHAASGNRDGRDSRPRPKQMDLLATTVEVAADQPSVNEVEPSCAAVDANAKTVTSFVAGTSNQLAHTAMAMVCKEPGTASPLFLFGPTGTGKTHMLAAIADQLRRRHRMRRVMHLSAEQFTNDFISSVGNSGITTFRRRYRDVDALLIDDVQFLGAKQATLREMLYTVETLAGAGRPLVFSGLQSPTEIPGLSTELAGRMAAGLVCPIQPLDMATREVLFRRWVEARCPISVPEEMIQQVNSLLSGDGRVISGVVNLINTLQRMLGRVPSMDELRQFGGDLLRAAKPLATLSVIEMAVCDAFRLSHDSLRSGSQTRAVTEPRMLAMYLSRQLTSSAYTEIARHFGGKSHSTAISAEKNVKAWLENGKAIGRGHAAMSAREAIDRVENLLRSG